VRAHSCQVLREGQRCVIRLLDTVLSRGEPYPMIDRSPPGQPPHICQRSCYFWAQCHREVDRRRSRGGFGTLAHVAPACTSGGPLRHVVVSKPESSRRYLDSLAEARAGQVPAAGIERPCWVERIIDTPDLPTRVSSENEMTHRRLLICSYPGMLTLTTKPVSPESA
jgi:hypothetical protein